MILVIRRSILLLAAIVVFCFDAHAVIVEGLYSATVPVQDQSENKRRQAIKQGLGDVLVKLTGSRTVLADPGVQGILHQAQKHLVEYGYVDQPPVSQINRQLGDLPGSQDGDQVEGLVGNQDDSLIEPQIGNHVENLTPPDEIVAPRINLNVSFQASAIQALLRELFLPIWPADRPVVMVWLVADTPEGYDFVDLADAGELAASLEEALKRRGVPFKSPLYDLQDYMALTPQQAWQGSDEQVQKASRRYGIDHWLVLRVNNTTNQADEANYMARWFLGGSGESSSGSVSEPSISELIDAAIGGAIDQYSLAFTYRAGQLGETTQLLITNIDSYGDFYAVMEMLQSLEVVNSTQVNRIDKDQLYLNLVTEGNIDVLVQALENNKQFSRIVDMSDSVGQSLYRFRWTEGSP